MVIIYMVTINAFCAPPRKVWHTMTLIDGREVEVMLVGDEHGHWFIDRNGKALSRGEDGKVFYLTEERLVQLKERRDTRMRKSNSRRIARMEARRTAAFAKSSANGMHKVFGSPTAISGEKQGIVILVNFSDKTFTNTREAFDSQFNEQGYSKNGHIGSVHDYFYDQSYGKLDLTFDVVGPVTLSKTHDYYGENDKDGDDLHPGEMVAEAIRLADRQGVDFSKYDWDGDGEVDQVFIIYAGTGEATSNNANDIWPHEWDLSSTKYYGDGPGPLNIDGVTIDTYAVANERTNSKMSAIGTACHEFSHCLGYADLYDVDYSGGQGMMSWDLMDSGSYNGPNDMGEVPAAFTSFERWWAGWIDLVELNSPQFICDMPAINDEPVAFVIYNDAHKDEYYLLENRQAKRWDSYTACNNNGTGHGMLILHVDYNKNVWEGNGPNDDPKHQRMTYFPADNSYGTKDYNGYYATFSQLAGDPFPGSKKITSFTDTSIPAATLYNANTDRRKFMGKPITDIEERNGLISFTFMGGIEAPETKEATQVSSDSFTANWTDVEGAESYELEVTEYEDVTGGACLFTETFSLLNKYNGDGTNNISGNIDEYTDVPGWTASVCFTSQSAIKLGSGTKTGYAITPSISEPSTGEVTIRASIKNYKTDDTKPQISIVDTNHNGMSIAKTCSATPSGDAFSTYILNFSDITKDFKVKFACPAVKKRFYLGQVDVFDGTYSEDELSSLAAKSIHKASKKTYTIADITSNSYTYTDVNEGMKYKYRVRAIVDGKSSVWSKYVDVLIETSVPSIKTLSEQTESRIYNLNGQFMGTNLSVLPDGIYIKGTRKIVKR